MSEKIKKQLLKINLSRSRDRFRKIKKSSHQRLVEQMTVGPYSHKKLRSEKVKSFLSDSDNVLVIACGRDEHIAGNLMSALQYAQKSSQGNMMYIDGSSSDGSFDVARSLGITAFRRHEILSSDHINLKWLAEVLAVQQKTLEGRSSKHDPPLQKGIDVLVARILLLQMQLKKKAPKYVIYLDVDLKSIPGGAISNKLYFNQVYYPLELLAAGMLEVKEALALFTGSVNRNNESLFAVDNTFYVDATFPYYTAKQQTLARAFYFYPSLITHPLTGEILVSVEMELSSIGATGHCVEVFRNLTLAGLLASRFGVPDLAELKTLKPFMGSVRLGNQLRLDELQSPKKEWWMLIILLPQMMRTVGTYCIRNEKLPQELDLDDYVRINQWICGMNEGSQINNIRQIKEFYRFPMERVIPPVTLLHKEGILNF